MMHRIRCTVKRFVRPGTLLHSMAEGVQRRLWRHCPGFFEWKTNKSHIDIDITMRCNLRCRNCNRGVAHAPSNESMAVGQIVKFVEESIAMGWQWRRIKLVGGEPTMHPEFGRLLEALAPYKRLHPKCQVAVITNGFGEGVREALANLPGWVTVGNTGKTSNVNTFQSFSVAPVDLDRFRNDDFSRGCFATEYCGVALTKSGFYCCAPGSAVDRVFGFDIGLKSLSAVTDAALKKQLASLCRYCGHYKYNYDEERVTTEEISPIWRDAFARYRRERPKLTPY